MRPSSLASVTVEMGVPERGSFRGGRDKERRVLKVINLVLSLLKWRPFSDDQVMICCSSSARKSPLPSRMK